MNRSAWVLVATLTAACEGSVVMPAGPSAVPPRDFTPPTGEPTPGQDACEGVPVAASTSLLRRLSVSEQRNTLLDLLANPSVSPALANQTGPIITEAEVEQLNLAVQTLVATKGHLAFLPCDAAGPFDAACADAFIADFGRFAFRRPLTMAEKAWLRDDVYNATRTLPDLSPAATFRECIDAVAQAILQSPQLLYVHETGVADASLPAGVRRLDGYERASRLSYSLWGTTPDATLLEVAETGGLDTADGVQAQAKRLMASPRSTFALDAFVSSWLELDGNSHQASLESAPKSAAAFPFDSPALRSAMRREITALFSQTFNAPGSSFNSLMTSRKAYVNKSLGALYGVAGAPTSDTTFAWVDLKAEERAGLFTRAAFLALYAPQEQKSPIRRGVFLYRRALCQPLGDPPANVSNIPLPAGDHPITTREEFEARTAAASCQGCHARINPLGFSLENYDAMGRYQTQEPVVFNGVASTLPVNAAVTTVATDFTGALTGPLDLARQLGTSGMAHDCLASTWFGQTKVGALTAGDACSLQRTMKRFRETDSLSELLLSLVSEDNALFIRESP